MEPNNNLLVVDARYNGPPGTGNGGWTAGLIARFLHDGLTEVTLQKPPPLDTPLTVIDTGHGLRVTSPDGAVIATAKSRVDDIAPVPAVSHDEAVAVSRNYAGFEQHHFPRCFVCGPAREDGLKVYPGKTADGRTASIFKVPEDVSDLTVWAALDCPGGWTVIDETHPWVLGRISVAVNEIPKPGQECVVMGQLLSEVGRKAVVRTTLYSPEDAVLARAEAVWIAIPPV